MTLGLSANTLLALAYRLTHARLVGVRPDTRGGERERIAALLEHEMPMLEPIAARDHASECMTYATDLEVLHTLACELIEIQDGQPVLRPVPIVPTLMSIVDPDILAIAAVQRHWRLEGRPEELELLSWPLLLRQCRDGFVGLFREVADTHVHFAGALPASVRWMMVITSAPSLDLAPRVSDHVDQIDEWARAIARARTCLLALAGRPNDASPGPDSLATAIRQAWPIAYRANNPASADDASPEFEGNMVLGHLIPERALLMRGLALGVEERERVFEYLRIKNAYHRAILLRPGGRGLARFDAALSRGWASESHQGQVRRARYHMSAVLESYLTNLGGHSDPRRAARAELSLELRMSLPPRGDRLRDNLRGWAIGAADVLRRWNDPPVRLGILFHLKRATRSGMPITAIGHEHVAHNERLFGWLVENPRLRGLVVGIDAAGDELAAPPRDFVRAFRGLRKLIDAQRPDRGLPIRLGFTFHAGEDFRDLLSGIRCAHEASELLGMRPNDRLGHGLALFWNAEDFYERRRAKPRMREHLLDLLWASALLEAHGKDMWARYARERLIALLVTLEARASTEVAVSLGHRLRHDARYHEMTDDELLVELLGPTLRHRALDQLRDVPADPNWRRFVNEARESAVTDVRNRGLYIEVNPTSNLLIGGFRDYGELPYIKEYAIPAEQLATRIPITINTDDPGLFHTSLTNEYIQVGRALLAKGMTHGQVRDWLDKARTNALQSSFIRPEAPSGHELWRELTELAEWRPVRSLG